MGMTGSGMTEATPAAARELFPKNGKVLSSRRNTPRMSL